MENKTGQEIDMSRQVMQTVMNHDWPGNVRELENAIEHAFVLCNSSRIEMQDLPVEILHRNTTGPGQSHTRRCPRHNRNRRLRVIRQG